LFVFCEGDRQIVLDLLILGFMLVPKVLCPVVVFPDDFLFYAELLVYFAQLLLFEDAPGKLQIQVNASLDLSLVGRVLQVSIGRHCLYFQLLLHQEGLLWVNDFIYL
jgi:hypothetical protein